jgi:cysteinyl-tRNA synthetase
MRDRIAAFERAFVAAVDDDLNLSQALGQVFEFMRDVNKLEPQGAAAQAAAAAVRRADEILGVLKPADEAAAGDDARIEALLRERQEARAARDFARADEIRDRLLDEGIIIEDTKDGARWYRK